MRWAAAARDRERVLAILKDSRHGSYGVLALVWQPAGPGGGAGTAGTGGARGLAAGRGARPRAPVVWLMAGLPYVTAGAVARSGDAARAGRPQLVVAMLLAAAIARVAALPAVPAPGDG